jgi:hypothetical protein
MKKNRLIVFILIFSISLSLVCIRANAEATGKLNVFTDLSGAEIYIDGQLAGKEAVVGYTLAVGTHFVKVVYQDKTVYAKTVEITEGRTNTITSDNFVDIRTSTPSRGAVDTEAERLREYRGNAGFGYFGTSPTSGLSFRWWFMKNLGIQAVGFTQTYSDYYENSCSGRLLIGFPQKIFAEEVLDAYMALGFGRSWHLDKNDTDKNTWFETSSIAFGIEGKLGSIANAIFLNNKSYVIQDMEGAMIMLGQLVTLGALNLCYIGVELCLEDKTFYSGTSQEKFPNMKVNYGIHYYF